MNIEGVSLSSSVNGSSKGGETSLPENGAAPDSFSTRLAGQVDLLNKTSPETSSPQSVKSTSPSLPNDTAKNIDGVSQSKSGEDIFSKLLINKASTSYQQNTALVAGKNLDLQSKLQALTAGEKSALVSSAPDAITIAQNMSAAMETHAQATTSAQSDKVVAASTLKDASKPITSNTMPEVMAANVQATTSAQSDKAVAVSTLKDASKPITSNTMSEVMAANVQATTSAQSDKAVAASTLKDASKPITSNTMPDAIAVAQNMSTVITTNAQVTMSIPADKATASSTLNDAPIPTMSDIMPDATAIAQNMSAVMTINAPVVINIPSDKTSTMLTETQNNTAPMPPSDLAVVASDSLQKEAAPNQSAQSGQASDLPSFDTLLSSEKTQAIKDLLTTSDAGQLATGVSRDIAGAQQPVITNKIESPVLTKPLTHPEWSKDLGNQIIWMNSKELSTAEIKMNPEHLGPISVRIDLTQDQASVEFTAQHAAVKEALEASIPKLREMLGTQQLNLTNVTISQSTTSDQGQSQSPYQSFSRTPERQEQGTEGVATGLSEEAAANRIVVNKGLLSVYA